MEELYAGCFECGSRRPAVPGSLRRAEAVRQLMIDMGTSETQIKHVIGLGYDHEFHVEDLNADGSLNEKNAPENRAVLVIGTSTEAAQILEKYYIE